MPDMPLVICIQGPTASGKSELAERLALEFDGEIVSADSMQIYRGMDIGTAKMPVGERRVPYHCLDILDPGQPYSAALFQRDARRAFAEIAQRGHVPILCGGTGFYVRAALDDLQFAPGEQQDNPLRQRLSQLLANEGETTRTVTVGDIYAITPFGNRLYTYDLTGAELAATVENSFKNSNYGDQFSGMVVKYTAEPDGKDENGRPVRGARTVVSIVLDDGTVVDIKDNTKTYRVAVNEYCATLPGSVFENKTPVQNVNEAPIDNISAIEALRAIGKANNGKLPLDLTERCVKVELVEEDPCEQYTDLDANAWYAESVHFALVNGLFVGFGDGTFRPEAALSRAMVATVLYRQAGSPAVTGTSTFPDLKDDWYADAVAWAQEAKVVIGDDKGLFRPDDDVTREEMVTMLYRFAASQNMDTTTTGDLSSFTDASSVQSYATEPMTWAVGNGIILGMGNNELAPRESATRAQFAAITARLAALK